MLKPIPEEAVPFVSIVVHGGATIIGKVLPALPQLPEGYIWEVRAGKAPNEAIVRGVKLQPGVQYALWEPGMPLHTFFGKRVKR